MGDTLDSGGVGEFGRCAGGTLGSGVTGVFGRGNVNTIGSDDAVGRGSIVVSGGSGSGYI